MNLKTNKILLIVIGSILIGFALYSLNLNSIIQNLTAENNKLSSELVQSLKTNNPVSSPSEDLSSHKYDYVYDLVKNIYPWQGIPTPSYFDWIGTGGHQSVFGYRLASGKIEDSLSDALTKVSAILNVSGWVDSQTEIADGVDGHVRGFEKDGKKLVFSVNDFGKSLVETDSRYMVLSFEPSGN